MSVSIDNALVQQYHSNVELQFQQRGSRLRGTVRAGTQHSETAFYDRLAPTAAVKKTTRHSDTPLIQQLHDRRAVTMEDFENADLIDPQDEIRSLADFTSPYAMNMAMSLGRALDDVIIEAALGTAATGKKGQTAVALPAGQVIDVDFNDLGAAVDSNLTLGKLRQGRQILLSSEAVQEDDGEKLYIIVSQAQITGLLRDDKLTSSDFSTVKALVNGEINSYMGYEFIRTERLTYSATDIRQVLIYPQSAIQVGMGKELNTRISERDDKSYSTQVYACGTFGAVRLWEEKVVVALCDETA